MGLFMKRKLVKQGAATLMVSLPSKWIKENKLGKGSEINLEEKQNELLISTEEARKQKKNIIIGITPKNKKDIKNILTHVYRKGFDNITIKGIERDSVNEIKNITNNLLLGFEVSKLESKEVVIENISEPSREKYSIILKKTFDIIKEAQDIMIEDFKSGSFKNYHEMENIRNQQDKYILFCKRLLIKENYIDNKLFEWELLTFLMHILHKYYYFYSYLSKNKIKVEKQMISLLEELKEYFNLYVRAYYDKDIENIHSINNLKDKFQFGEALKLIEKSYGKNSVAYCYIREIFRLIQIGASPILGEILEVDMNKLD